MADREQQAHPERISRRQRGNDHRDGPVDQRTDPDPGNRDLHGGQCRGPRGRRDEITISKDQEIKELRRQIKKNQKAIHGLIVQKNKKLFEANKMENEIRRRRAENTELMKRLNVLGNQKLKDRIEIVPANPQEG